MSKGKGVACFMFGDVRTDEGFWFSHQLTEIEGLTEEQLFWVPEPNSLCILWHLDHIAHRERTHLGIFLQGLQETLIPPQYEVFGPDWCSVENIQKSIDSVANVMAWVRDVRKKSQEYIVFLTDDDFHKVPLTSEFGLSAAHWLFIIATHAALHIGRIQLLRVLIEGKPERAC